MKLMAFFLVLMLLSGSMWLAPATYKGKKIDSRWFTGKLWQKGQKAKLSVEVIFVEKMVTITVTDYPNQITRSKVQFPKMAMLYLLKEMIENPKKVPLKQIRVPFLPAGQELDPYTCPIISIWLLNVDLKKPKKM